MSGGLAAVGGAGAARERPPEGAAPPRRLRVLLLNHVSGMSGGEAGLLDTLRSVDAGRVEFRVGLPPGGPLVERVRGLGVPVVPLPMRRFRRTASPLRLAACAANVARVAGRLVPLVRRGGIDLLHANGDGAQLYAAAAGRLTGCPVVWHTRDLTDLGRMGRLLARLSARVIATSGAVARRVASFAPGGERLVTVPNGIDAERFRARGAGAAVRAELGIRPDEYVAAMAGQTVPWKNHALFLRAAARAAQAGLQARFLLIGADVFGDDAACARRIESLAASPALAGRVRLTGWRADMPAVYESLDVLVHPAGREPFGRVVAEAMAAGRPVVAADGGGPAEIIRDGVDGLLVPADDEEAMARAILRLAADRGLAARLGAAARERICRDFSLAAYGERIEAVYRSVWAEQHGERQG